MLFQTTNDKKSVGQCEGKEWEAGGMAQQLIKSTGCSSKGPGTNSQDPHGSSQSSVTTAPGLPREPGTHVVNRYTHRQNIHVRKMNV